MRVVVYASARPQTPSKFLVLAQRLGVELAEKGHICVNGGGKFGGMGALNKSCKEAGGEVVAVIHEMWVDGELFEDADEIIKCKGPNLAERKEKLMEKADCLIVLPGGVGTLDELWDATAQRQLQFTKIPICLVSPDDYYEGSLKQLQRAYDEGLVGWKPQDLLHAETTPEAAIKWCTEEVGRMQAKKDAEAGKDSSKEAEEVTEKPRPFSFFAIVKGFLILPPILFCYTWLFMKTVWILMYFSGELKNQT